MGSHIVTCHPTQVNTPRLDTSQSGRYLIYLPRRDGRLSWPRWSVFLSYIYMLFVSCDQPILGRRSHCSSSWLQLTSTSVGKLKPFQNRSGTMCCKSSRWRKIPDPSCSCGAAEQTMSHIVNDCPLPRFPGGLTTLHLAGDEAVKWLGMQYKQ